MALIPHAAGRPDASLIGMEPEAEMSRFAHEMGHSARTAARNSPLLQGLFVFALRLVQMFSRRKLFELLEMLRPERLGDHVLFLEPLSQINQPAALRAKGTGWSGKPVANFPASRA